MILTIKIVYRWRSPDFRGDHPAASSGIASRVCRWRQRRLLSRHELLERGRRELLLKPLVDTLVLLSRRVHSPDAMPSARRAARELSAQRYAPEPGPRAPRARAIATSCALRAAMPSPSAAARRSTSKALRPAAPRPSASSGLSGATVDLREHRPVGSDGTSAESDTLFGPFAAADSDADAQGHARRARPSGFDSKVRRSARDAR